MALPFLAQGPLHELGFREALEHAWQMDLSCPSHPRAASHVRRAYATPLGNEVERGPWEPAVVCDECGRFIVSLANVRPTLREGVEMLLRYDLLEAALVAADAELERASASATVLDHALDYVQELGACYFCNLSRKQRTHGLDCPLARMGERALPSPEVWAPPKVRAAATNDAGTWEEVTATNETSQPVEFSGQRVGVDNSGRVLPSDLHAAGAGVVAMAGRVIAMAGSVYGPPACVACGSPVSSELRGAILTCLNHSCPLYGGT